MRAHHLVLVAVLATGCGTTVPQSGTATGAGSGLTPASSGAATGPGSAALGPASTTGAGITPGSGPGGPAGPAGSGTTSGGGALGAPPSAAPAGASRITSALKIGISYVDTSDTNDSLGVSGAATVTAKSAAEAFVRALNAHGGLAGRHLDAVEYGFNGNDADYSADATKACTTFTQDNHVAVVLDYAFGNIGGFQSCLQKHNVLDLTTAVETDRHSAQAATLHDNTRFMSVERTYSAVLQESTGTGYLSKATQLGVIIEGCPADTTAYENTLRPLTGRLGLRTPVEATLSCTNGFADAGPATSAISNAILRFRQAGVDKVMFVSGFEQTVLLLFAQAADSQGYAPGYALSSIAQTAALRPNLPKNQWPGLHGVGNVPGNDVETSASATAVESRCLALARAGGLSPATRADRTGVFAVCAPFLLLERLLQATSGSSEAGSLAAAAASIGTGFSMPGLIQGASRFTAQQHDSPTLVQTFAYNATCTCVRYAGSPVPAPA